MPCESRLSSNFVYEDGLIIRCALFGGMILLLYLFSHFRSSSIKIIGNHPQAQNEIYRQLNRWAIFSGLGKA